MDGEKIILSQNEKKKNRKKKCMASIEARIAKLYFIANGRFSHSGSQMKGVYKDEATSASIADLDLWLKRFELYVKQINIPEEEWAAELLPLLDDAAFRVVSQLGLESSTDYGALTTSLNKQFFLMGNELEWQPKWHTQRQQPGEQLIQYAGALRVMADKAYQCWTVNQEEIFFEATLFKEILHL